MITPTRPTNSILRVTMMMILLYRRTAASKTHTSHALRHFILGLNMTRRRAHHLAWHVHHTRRQLPVLLVARAKTFRPTEVTRDLSLGLMAKLMIDADDAGRTETWQVGRLKSAKEVRAVLPQGATGVSCYTFV